MLIYYFLSHLDAHHLLGNCRDVGEYLRDNVRKSICKGPILFDLVFYGDAEYNTIPLY